MHLSLRSIILIPAVAMSFGAVCLAGHPAQGLWVGDVELNAVNEATGAVGNSNTYEFTDPQITTSTSDAAYLRLIIHVNGAGQASLLKSVAIVEREVFADGSTDILLITDPSLYPLHPGIAKRIASASFDFGNQQAVTAVQSLIDTATAEAVTTILDNNSATAAAVEAAVLANLQGIVTGANVDLAYMNRATGATSFITSQFFDEAMVISIANATAALINGGTKTAADFAFNPATDDTYAPFASDPPGSGFNALVTTAISLRDNSFYRDTRGLEAIAGVVYSAALAAEAAGASADLAIKEAKAQVAAIYARHNAADITQAYNRFLAGSAFNAIRSTIPDVAVAAAIASKNAGKTEAQIITDVRDALIADGSVGAAFTAAVTLKSASLWSDVRAEDAVNAVVDSAATAAAAQVMISTAEAALKKAVEDAAVDAFNAVPFAPVFADAPTPDYNAFVTASGYQAAATTAAKSAASEVVFQFNAGVSNPSELTFFAKRAVTKALTTTRESAAIIPQNSIPLTGRLTPGGSLSGTIHLPALAPTNPFMHRRHPDHTEGFPITRKISLSVAEPGAGDTGRAGYGVSRISGTYFEEIDGLHKPLGPSQNIGLRTQGNFTLNRLTFVETLNF